ncbi:MAG: hypothetical protein DDT37_01120 [Firmicutes bacterium]|nr:hypothetical protein [candidate division NPL-UPA2 bacterium]MBT9154494.1 hypothetical protein [candidate division NPL-UPA2 bacterium]MBT9156136.1 hypothetical protein [candidate division NPL-UPA2 bacterium]
MLAGSGADPADGSRQRHKLFDQLHRLPVAAVGNQAHISLRIAVGRTGQYARRTAVSAMVGKNQLQRRFTRFSDFLVISADDHPFADFGGTSPQQLWHPGHLHQTETTGGVNFQFPAVAQRGDKYIVLPSHVKYGLTAFARQLPAVYIYLTLAHKAHSLPKIVRLINQDCIKLAGVKTVAAAHA